jgi:hypothetical protein
VAPSSSSTRKAAKLAQKGKGKRVRFQGGTLFPMVVAIVLVLGLALIVYARTSRPAADASPPQVYDIVNGQQIGDHWHGAYGFQVCGDTPTIKLAGDLEARDTEGRLISQAMQTTGIHSHDDGVIHWHAWSSRASGRNAQIGIFLDNYDVSLSNDTLELPEGDGDNPLSRLIFDPETSTPEDPEDFPLTYEEDETQCNGEDAELRVMVWTDFNDPDSGQLYTSNFDDIPFDQDGLVITIAFVPDDVEVVMPTWAANLPELGAADSATGVVPEDTVVLSTDASETTTDGTGASDTTEASESSEGSATTEASDTTAAADTTEPADTTEASDTTEG